jgi:tetratricopeptide (TPR) repeat protein
MQGFKAQKTGDLDSAIALYEKAAETDPTYATPYNDLGVIYQRKGDLERAEKSFLTALQIKPDYAGVYTNLALLYEDRGDIPRAMAYWEKRASMGRANDPYVIKAKENLLRLQGLDSTDFTDDDAIIMDYDAQQEMIMNSLVSAHMPSTLPAARSTVPDVLTNRPAAAPSRSGKKAFNKLVSRAKKDIYDEQYQDALDKLFEAKSIDAKVQFLDELIDEARSRSIDHELERASMNADLYKKAQLLEVENAWYPPIPEPQPVQNYTENFKGVKKTAARLELERKAKEVIPKIDFKEAQLKEVIEFLAVSNDINIVIDETVVPRNETVTIYLTNIPLDEALDIILRTKGLKYRFEENIIWITTEEKLLEEDLVVRVYDVQDLVGKLFDFPSKPFEFKPAVKEVQN